MGTVYYDSVWRAAMADLLDQIQKEATVHLVKLKKSAQSADKKQKTNDKNALSPEEEQKRVDQANLSIYLESFHRYMSIYRKLNGCHDQMIHFQKRELVRRVLNAVITHMVDLYKKILPITGYLHPDILAPSLGAEPSQDGGTPFSLFSPEDTVPTSARDRLFHSGVNDMVAQFAKRYGTPVDGALQTDADGGTPSDTSESLEWAVALIQRAERVRQARERSVLMAQIRTQERTQDGGKAQSLKGVNEIVQSQAFTENRAAILVQRIARGYCARKNVKLMKKAERCFYGFEPLNTMGAEEAEGFGSMLPLLAEFLPSEFVIRKMKELEDQHVRPVGESETQAGKGREDAGSTGSDGGSEESSSEIDVEIGLGAAGDKDGASGVNTNDFKMRDQSQVPQLPRADSNELTSKNIEERIKGEQRALALHTEIQYKGISLDNPANLKGSHGEALVSSDGFLEKEKQRIREVEGPLIEAEFRLRNSEMANQFYRANKSDPAEPLPLLTRKECKEFGIDDARSIESLYEKNIRAAADAADPKAAAQKQKAEAAKMAKAAKGKGGKGDDGKKETLLLPAVFRDMIEGIKEYHNKWLSSDPNQLMSPFTTSVSGGGSGGGGGAGGGALGGGGGGSGEVDQKIKMSVLTEIIDSVTASVAADLANRKVGASLTTKTKGGKKGSRSRSRKSKRAKSRSKKRVAVVAPVEDENIAVLNTALKISPDRDPAPTRDPQSVIAELVKDGILRPEASGTASSFVVDKFPPFIAPGRWLPQRSSGMSDAVKEAQRILLASSGEKVREGEEKEGDGDKTEEVEEEVEPPSYCQLVDRAYLEIILPSLLPGEEVQKSKTLLVLGSPGSGRSHFIRWIAHKLHATILHIPPAEDLEELPEHTQILIAKAAIMLQPCVVVCGDLSCEYEDQEPCECDTTLVDPTLVKKKKKGRGKKRGKSRGRGKRKLNEGPLAGLDVLKSILKPTDRVLIACRAGSSIGQKTGITWDHVFWLPLPTYSDRVTFWRAIVNGEMSGWNALLKWDTRHFGPRPILPIDTSTAARLSDGYTPGELLESMSAILEDVSAARGGYSGRSYLMNERDVMYELALSLSEERPHIICDRTNYQIALKAGGLLSGAVKKKKKAKAKKAKK